MFLIRIRCRAPSQILTKNAERWFIGKDIHEWSLILSYVKALSNHLHFFHYSHAKVFQSSKLFQECIHKQPPKVFCKKGVLKVKIHCEIFLSKHFMKYVFHDSFIVQTAKKCPWYTFWSISWNIKILKIEFQNFLYRERLSYWICFHALIILLSMTSAKI